LAQAAACRQASRGEGPELLTLLPNGKDKNFGVKKGLALP